ncbi:MAG TPA: sarcosine oxidase subunit gamma [Mesorhizobium sp.]|jgi:sarcosine oxidase, subunit gamma|nr:sarcosine oxidase subunit gamma [Mesorhizobium sp.]
MAKAPAISSAAARSAALAGRNAGASGVAINVLAPAERISLRAPAASIPALSKALGVPLPQKPKTSALSKGNGIFGPRSKAGTRAALWLGPDEWLIIDEAGRDPKADCQPVRALHSAVGISHRNVGISVSGPAAAATINAGCPQDLSLAAFPVGACSRTVFGKVEIVLWRTADDVFRVECWRSFSDYVFTFLTEAARDAAA